jgi:hypothetical protein
MQRSRLPALCGCFLLCWSLHTQAQSVCQTTFQSAVDLAWMVGPPPTGASYTAFLLERQVDTGGFMQIADLPPSQFTVPDGGLVVGHTYTYRLRDEFLQPDNQLMVSGYSNAPCVTILADTMPTGLAAVATPGAVMLSWRTGQPAEAVVIERRRDTQAFTTLATTSATTYTDRTVRRRTQYCYRLRYATSTLYTAPACVRTP